MARRGDDVRLFADVHHKCLAIGAVYGTEE
jgi:hypothetical protein